EALASRRLEFGHLGRRVIEGRFDVGNMTRDGGVMLLAKLDQRLGLTDAAARCITDPREPSTITHSIRDMLRQRVYGLVQGWEDLNNHSQLRHDIAYQTAVGREHDLASAPTLCRLEKLDKRTVPSSSMKCWSAGYGKCGAASESSSGPLLPTIQAFVGKRF
ncbi:MAG: transposase, partial [Rhodocyclaceae bacterium]|nr:transposase [Rhodocyclaceae bacterium]